MDQMSFGDAEYAAKNKTTRREVSLAEMHKVVPWDSLLRWTEEQVQALAGHADVAMTRHYMEGHEAPWQPVESGLELGRKRY